MEKNLFLLTENEARKMFQNAVVEGLTLYEKEKARGNSEKLFSINQVSKRLGMAHATIRKLVNSGIIKATRDNKISEKSINEYLDTK